MIVRRDERSLLLISQPDHAALAGLIMRHWLTNDLPESPRRADILLAVDEHDNGWREVDSAPVIDEETGRILDFVTAPDSIRRGVWPRGVNRLSARPYAAALVAQHGLHVYSRYRAATDWQPFFSEMASTRDAHLHNVEGATLDQLANDYLFVRMGDLLSLTFCNLWRDTQNDVSGHLVRLNGTHVTVTPDPFGGSKVSLEVRARRLPNERFASISEASRAFSSAPTVKLTGTLSGTILP